MAYADLHIHTRYSDGSATVREVYERAVRNGAGLIAVSDHNQTEGAKELLRIRDGRLAVIPSIEFCSFFHGNDHHVLGLGVDLYNRRLSEAAMYSRRRLDRMSEVVVERMAADYPNVSLPDFLAFPEERELGGWKFLRYAVARGAAADTVAALSFYGRYDATYAGAGFLPIKDVIDVIHEAGGRAVLAHPGIYGTTEECVTQVQEAFTLGADGCECYYSEHTAETESAMLSLCRAENRLITAGSDYHGIFFGSSGDICETKTECGKLELGDITVYR